MSNKISRRAFLKVTGVSALALGAASMLGGCQSSNGSVEVKVGDKVSNWNNLGVQLSSVCTRCGWPPVCRRSGHGCQPLQDRQHGHRRTEHRGDRRRLSPDR